MVGQDAPLGAYVAPQSAGRLKVLLCSIAAGMARYCVSRSPLDRQQNIPATTGKGPGGHHVERGNAGNAGKAGSRSRPDLAAAQNPSRHQGLGAAARLSAVHARDRRRGRARQHLQRLLPIGRARTEGLSAPERPQAAHRGSPAAIQAAGPGTAKESPRLCADGEADYPRRPSAGRQANRRRFPAAQAAGWRGHRVPAGNGRQFHDQRRDRRRRLARRPSASGRGGR